MNAFAIAGIIVVIIVLGIIIIKVRKNKDNIKNAQGLYGPPKMFEPPEDFYGCPRPDDIDEESEENTDEKD